MEIVIKTFLRQIITQCAGTQDAIKKVASCDPCGRKSGLKTVAFLLRLSIYIHSSREPVIKLEQNDRWACLDTREENIDNYKVITYSNSQEPFMELEQNDRLACLDTRENIDNYKVITYS